MFLLDEMKKAKRQIAAHLNLGRRPASSPKIDRQSILKRGLELSKKIALQDLSVVKVAAEMGVTAASIRYHLKGRDALTAGIVSMFYRDLLERWPEPQGSWKADLSAVAETIYRSYLRYAGIAAYFAAENRFRVVASAIRAEDDGTTPLFLERYFGVVRQIGLDVERSTNYGIILLQLLHMAAHATTRHQWPGEHNLLRRHLESLDTEQFPHTTEMRESYLRMAGETAFRSALHLVLSGLEQERRAKGNAGA